MQCLPPKISQKVTSNERRRREYQGAERALMGVAGEGSGERAVPYHQKIFSTLLTEKWRILVHSGAVFRNSHVYETQGQNSFV